MTGAHLVRRWQPTALRARILGATAALAAVALLLGVTGFHLTLDRVLVQSATDAARDEAAHAAALLHDPSVTAAQAMGEEPSHSLIIEILDRSGRVVATTHGPSGGPALVDVRPAPGTETTRAITGLPGHPHDPYAVVALGLPRPTPDSGTTVLVVSPLDGEIAVVNRATWMLAGLSVLLLLGLLLGVDRVLRQALGSVDTIRASVDAIRATGEDERVHVPPGDDEITRLARTMNAMLDRLARTDAAQRAFVSNASHELRSPLTTIRMATEMSPQGLDADTTRLVADEARAMHRLVEDLLTLATFDDRGLGLEHRDVDLDEIVLAEAQRVRAVSPLAVDVEVVAARTTGDPQRLSQVAHNLVDNAMRHARTGVRLRCGIEGATAVLDVDNDGAVVPVEDRGRIFERFARLEDARDRDSGGSGLGLAIVHALVEAHGGTVSTLEAPDGWCRFRVVVPAAVVPDPGWDDLDDAPDDLDGTDPAGEVDRGATAAVAVGTDRTV